MTDLQLEEFSSPTGAYLISIFFNLSNYDNSGILFSSPPGAYLISIISLEHSSDDKSFRPLPGHI